MRNVIIEQIYQFQFFLMLLSINPVNPNPLRVKKVVDVLKNDGIIIYPTDTVYGLGCSIFSKKAMKRLLKIKKVNQKKPLTLSLIHI